MNRLLIGIIFLACGYANGQTLFTENFDVFPTTWTKTNQSEPVGISNWAQGGNTLFNGGFNGGSTSFTSVNFNSVAMGMSGTISNWLITPVISLKNGDVIKFYSRVGANFSTIPDRLEVRLSTQGNSSTTPSTGSSDLGSFTNLILSINPNLQPSVYPTTWTEFIYTVVGLSSETDCKLAFRYYVTNGGSGGTNGNAVGIDALTINRTLSTDDFFSGNFTAYPNPSSDILKIANNTNVNVNSIEITDMNGRVVKQVKGMVDQISVSELNAGVYFLKITSDKGTGTTKIIKK
ncbi:MAG: choice-of-anchor J domain-containing protein [Flavobacteriaceae bacterium]